MPRAFAKSLFFGEVAYDVAFPFPEMGRQERERVGQMLDDLRARAAEWGHAEANATAGTHVPPRPIPRTAFDDCAASSLFASCIPESAGGAPLSHLARARVLEGIGHEDLAIGIAMASAATAAPLALVEFGKPELQTTWLPRIARGDVLGAFALAETGAGSDAGGIHTRAELDETGCYVLHGAKAWVTNAHVADAFVVFARTSPADEDAKPKLTAFFVPRDATVVDGGAEATLGLDAIGCPLVRFEGTRVSPSAVLGEPGRGFKVAVELFNRNRILVAAAALGAVKSVIRYVLRRCDERRAFGRNIGEFGLVKGRVAEMLVDAFTLESLLYWTCGLADADDADVSIESALCKIVAADVAERTAANAFHVFASAAYLDASPIARFVRDTRALTVLHGTNDVLSCFVALSGMQEPGREIADVAKAIREPIKGFGLLSDLAIRRAKSALGVGTSASPVPSSLAREGNILETYAQELARASDKALRRHGSNIAEMQFTQSRIASMTSDLVTLTACIARAAKSVGTRGEEGSRRELDMLRVFAASAERRLAAMVGSFDVNDDELRKTIASRAYLDGAYPLEALEG